MTGTPIHSDDHAESAVVSADSGDDGTVIFNGADKGYELILEKDEKTGEWARPAQ